MTIRDVAMTAFAAVALVLVQAGAAGAQQADLWTVANVAVDATGVSPSAAKEAALAQGRQKAWTEVFKRITPSSEWSRQPKLSDQELEPMVKSFGISGEKHSSTRYLATVTYVFNPAAVRAALRRSGTQFSESTAKPVLVVPLSGTAWSPESPWGRAWAIQAQRGRLVPVTVPVGDVQDMTALATISSAADWPIVKSLADRYGANSVLLASATKAASGLQVSMTHIRPDGRAQRNGSFAPQGAEDESALALRSAGSIADSLQEDWKRTTSVDYGQQSSIIVSVPVSSLAEWVSIKRHLQSTRLIQHLAIEELNMGTARVRLDYVGKVEQLQTALAQTNLSLSADAAGNWTLSRNAAATAAAPPG
jgi:hypothetical protein